MAKVTDGLRWALDQAKVVDSNSFQSDDGKPMAYVKLAYFGGLTTIMVTPEDARRFEPLIGKMVTASGGLIVEKKRSGVSVQFSIDVLEAIKAS